LRRGYTAKCFPDTRTHSRIEINLKTLRTLRPKFETEQEWIDLTLLHEAVHAKVQQETAGKEFPGGVSEKDIWEAEQSGSQHRRIAALFDEMGKEAEGQEAYQKAWDHLHDVVLKSPDARKYVQYLGTRPPCPTYSSEALKEESRTATSEAETYEAKAKALKGE
jgi:hypothetical protein